jgi:hypothetical protein
MGSQQANKLLAHVFTFTLVYLYLPLILRSLTSTWWWLCRPKHVVVLSVDFGLWEPDYICCVWQWPCFNLFTHATEWQPPVHLIWKTENLTLTDIRSRYRTALSESLPITITRPRLEVVPGSDVVSFMDVLSKVTYGCLYIFLSFLDCTGHYVIR